ncbi:MAG TPA: hypothetical protein VEJ38_06760, partial [Candidatus Acidoferrales bacterium]|nr:hypothetical protein [Candidatus Acidoferrales bacterium]
MNESVEQRIAAGPSGRAKNENRQRIHALVNDNGAGAAPSLLSLEEQNGRIEEFPEVKALEDRCEELRKNGFENTYFSVHERVANETSVIGGCEYLNFASYNYLGLSGDPEVTAAAIEALRRYGTSVSASRLVSGEKPLHRELEREIAEFLGCEDAI